LGRDSILVGRGSVFLGLETFFGGKGFMLWAKELDSFEEGAYFLGRDSFFWEGLDSCREGIDSSWAWDIFLGEGLYALGEGTRFF
jgi:hypothetical protein